MHKMNKIKLIFLNVNSLISCQKRHYFNLFLQTHKPDIMLVAEHKLSYRHKISFKGYNFIPQKIKAKRNGLSEKGGTATAIFIKEHIQYERIEIDQTTNLENIAIVVHLKNNRKIAVASLYNRPQDNLITTDLDKVLECLNEKTNEIIWSGDFNARHPNWGDTQTNTKGRVLENWLQNCPMLKIIPTKFPTRVSTNNQSFLDFFFDIPVC